jgi:hypothetical protein
VAVREVSTSASLLAERGRRLLELPPSTDRAKDTSLMYPLFPRRNPKNGDVTVATDPEEHGEQVLTGLYRNSASTNPNNPHVTLHSSRIKQHHQTVYVPTESVGSTKVAGRTARLSMPTGERVVRSLDGDIAAFLTFPPGLGGGKL